MKREPWIRSVKAMVGSAITQQVCGLVIVLSLTRFLGADGYGTLTVAIAGGTSVYAWCLQWVAPAMVRDIAATRDFGTEARTAFFGFAIVQVGLAALTAVLVIVARRLGLSIVLPAFDSAWWIAPFAGLALMQLLRNGLQGLSLFRTLAWAGIAEKALQLGLVWIAIGGGFLNALVSIFALAASSASVAVVSLYFLLRRVPPPSNLRPVASAMIRSWRFFLMTGLAYLSSNPFMILIAAAAFGPRSAAPIGIGVTLAGLLQQPLFWILPTLLPRFVQTVQSPGDDADARYLRFLLAAPLATAMSAVAGIVVLLASPGDITHLLGHGFEQNGSLIALIVLSSIPEGVHAALVPVLVARHKERFLLIGAILRAIPFLLVAIGTDSPIGLVVAYSLCSWISVAVDAAILAMRVSVRGLAALSICGMVSVAMVLALWHGAGLGIFVAASTCVLSALFAFRWRHEVILALRGSRG